MSYTFKQDMLSSSKYSLKAPYYMDAQYITIHNTSNSASAQNEISYMKNNNNATSFHVCVDENYVIQAIPFNRNAWHAGDGGSGTGNRKSIGIEIARSTGDANLFARAEQNCAEYVAKLLKERGWGIDRVKRHKDWSGKNCPHKTMEKGWQRFLNMIQAELNKLNGKTNVKPTQNNVVTGTNFLVKVKVSSLNIRKEASFTSAVVGTVKKGDVFTIVETKNGLGRLKSGLGWISMGTEYVERVNSTQQTSNTYKVKIVNCSVLNVRAGAGTQYAVTTTVKAGDVFTIVAEVNGWLKLFSGAGYIRKTYTQRI